MGDVMRNPLVLPEDVLVVRVSELPNEVRRKIGKAAEEFAIMRPLAREPGKLIDAAAAKLIEQFREPRTIVQAIVSYTRTNSADPQRTLKASLPLLRQMLRGGLLVPKGTEETHRIEASYLPGDDAASYRILRCVQTFEDSELYEARAKTGKIVALKIARKEYAGRVQPQLEREIAALRQLAARFTPRLVDHGVLNERPFLATEWIIGTNISTASADLRASNDREGLLQCIVEIVRAYVAIHERGVLHGDVHPGNILIGRNGTITLIDFGLAQFVGDSSDADMRGGVGFYMEPEYARAMLKKRPPPRTTGRGEQFAIAALLYAAVTGQHYMDFTLQQEEMFRQIRKACPVPFEQRGIEPWPELEAVFARALSVTPAKRFRDMAAFAEALAKVSAPRRAPAIRAAHCGTQFLKDTLAYVGLDGSLYRDGLGTGPLCSINFGVAGVAYGLYRIACRRDDPRMLAAADAWLTKAQVDADKDAAFYNRDLGLTEDIIGRVSLYNDRPGGDLVHALIADARGEHPARDAAVSAFLANSDLPCLQRDLTLGRSGVVLGCAMLLEGLVAAGRIRNDIRSAGQRRVDELWTEIAGFELIARGRQWPNVGIAHGWAGLLYATLRWHDAISEPIPANVHDRLIELIDTASATGRGLTWPWRDLPNDDGPASMPGWCNGSAGMTHLFCLAHRSLGDDKLLEAAEGAAWHAWEGGGGPADLCCGYAGRAYALLEMYRASGDEKWRKRAQRLAERAVDISSHMRSHEHPRHSLYKGELGLALLISDLEEPQHAAMPLFASERWQE
jgi:serine/threonine-protein kinase